MKRPRFAVLEYPPFPAFCDELVNGVTDGFRGPKKECSSIPETVTEGGKDLLLDIGIEIDEKIPATDHVKIREGRIRDDIMHCEYQGIPYLLIYPIGTIGLDEESFQSFIPDIGFDADGIDTCASRIDGCLINICGKYLDPMMVIHPVDVAL